MQRWQKMRANAIAVVALIEAGPDLGDLKIVETFETGFERFSA